MLTQIGLEDGSRYNFNYTSWGQIYKITHQAADSTSANPHQLSYTSYNLPMDAGSDQHDCPRFSQRQDWAENWNNNNPVITSFQIDPNGASGEVTIAGGTSDQVRYKEFFTRDYSDWRRGLVTRTEIYTPNSTAPKKTAITDWTQDVTNVAYALNPRPTATTVYDAEGNRRRTTIEYTIFGLPSDVYEMGPYGPNDWRILRRAHTDYNLSDAYVNRRIIGLVAGQYLLGPDAPNSYSIQTLVSKTTFEYDNAVCSGSCYTFGPEGPEAPQAPADPVVQHDHNYGVGFQVGRGLLAKALQWDVLDEMNAGKVHASSMRYNVTGSLIRSQDPLLHSTQIFYEDAFSNDGNTINSAPYVTLAYPTMIADADNKFSSAKYNYDLGTVTRQQDPKGAAQTTEYDSARRIKRVTSQANGAYMRFVYSPSQTIVNKFTTIKDIATEAYSATILDGAGRVRSLAGDFPNSNGHYTGQFSLYDQQGRKVRSTNPTEMNHAWMAAGDDVVGWYSSSQSYDWKGRPLLTTNTDGTTEEASYGGCGCAGGEVVTLTDEGTMDAGVFKRRQKKTYADSLGRTVKTELLNWRGGSVYSTTINTFNARDQITSAKAYQGDVSGPYQESFNTFDGYGRLVNSKTPVQTRPIAYAYNADDTVWKIFTPREATGGSPDDVTMTFTYNNRRLPRRVEYAVPANLSIFSSADYVAPKATVEFDYDSAGNRIWMTDGLGRVDYSYDTLSRLLSETRTFNDPANPSITNVAQTLSYGYNLRNEITHMIAPGARIDYSYNNIGQLDGVGSSGVLYADVSNYVSAIQYRAWGALKAWSYGNTRSLSLQYNARLQLTRYEVPGVTGSEYEYITSQSGVNDNDGRVKFVRDLTISNSKFDRAYAYDHVGRISQAVSGPAARGEADVNNRPFKQSNTYDQWNNLTSRTGKHWSAANGFNATIDPVTDRNQSWIYDANGFVKTQNGVSNSYDAAGQVIKNIDTQPRGEFAAGLTLEPGYDGDGLMIKHVQNGTKKYFLRSSAMKGQIIAEVGDTGQFLRGYVYAGSTLIAKQESGAVDWFHRNPVTGNENRTAASGGTSWPRTEVDPLGVEVGTFDWYLFGGRPQGDFVIGSRIYSDPGRTDLGCTLDFVVTDCELVSRLFRAEAVQVQYSEFGRDREGKREPLRERVKDYGLGVYGVYLPDGSLGNDSQLDLYFFTFPEESQHARRPQPRSLFNSARLEWCLRHLFNVKFSQDETSQQDGSFGFDSLGAWFKGIWKDKPIDVRTDMTTYSMADVGPMHGKTVGLVGGFTNLRQPNTNFVASDLLQRGYDFEVVRAAWVHELGNSLAAITDQPQHAKLAGMLAWDKDSGNALEECVYGGKVVNNTTVTTDPGR
jgi:hypothetical protein